ncbi:MAG: Mrp/NBP35 family ATP-binding protein [Deltaproteobacteria bacterium]|nr:Mrp/NBP35 family ATP-binding protein [Deltaproteobacteria bacterium]
MKLNPEGIRNILNKVKYPGFTRDIVSFGVVKEIEVEGSKVKLYLVLPKPDEKLESEIRNSVIKTLLESPGVSEVDVMIGARELKGTPGQARTVERAKLPEIKYFIAVASGKGGVGKSTVAVNLALSISKMRKNVGLMDADIWGPSTPIMLGINERPRSTPDQKIIPLEKFGLKLMSIGFLINDDDTVIWRGPMVHGAVKQFIEDVEWKGTDYLVIDLPPGTGDAQLSLIQTAPLSGGVIVTTPQDVALIDVRRGVQMFKKLNVPVLGIIENMSYLVCPHCSGEVDIFSKGGGKRMAEKFDVPFLGEIPIDPEIRKGGDDGIPIVVSHPESAAAKAFTVAAEKILKIIEETA